MKKRIAARGYGFIPVLILLLVSVMSARAQGQLKNSGKHVGELVPSGWEHMEATGDLNKDGITDLIVSATTKQPYVIEVNSSPGTKGITTAAGDDVVGTLFNMFKDFHS